MWNCVFVYIDAHFRWSGFEVTVGGGDGDRRAGKGRRKMTKEGIRDKTWRRGEGKWKMRGES
jgi:hypothetical protein